MDAKSKNPATYLNDKDINPIIRAYYEFNHLKGLYRRGWLKRGVPEEHCESVAEHSLGVAVLAGWLAEANYPDLDPCKVLRMALVHDFGEIHAGDIIPGDGIPEIEKHALEHESIAKVLGDLPGGEAYIQLWEEYEAGVSAEARFVRQVDRLEMALQASVYEHRGYRDMDEFYQSAASVLDDPNLASVLRELVDSG